MSSLARSGCALACLGAACGLDVHGTGPSDGGSAHDDERGSVVAADGGPGATGNPAGSSSSGGGGGPLGIDAGSPGFAGGSAGLEGGSEAATVEGGLTSPDGSVVCNPNGNCPPGKHASCTSDQQCAQDDSARFCDTSTGTCVGCRTSTDCPQGQSVCDPTVRTCVECVSNADCAGTSTPACAQNRCVPCATNADCSGVTPFCRLGGDSPWQCVACLQNSDCPPGLPSCSGGTCRQPGN